MKGLALCFVMALILALPLWAAPVNSTSTPESSAPPVPVAEIPVPSPVPPGSLTATSTPDPDPVQDMTQYSRENFVTLSVDPFFGVPLSAKTAQEYNVGGGGELFIGVSLNKNLLLGLNLGLEDYTVKPDYFARVFQETYGVIFPTTVTVSGDWTVTPAEVMAKYFLEEGAIRPYLLGGLGMAINQVSVSASSGSEQATLSVGEVDLLASLGLGVDFRTDLGLDFFLQARVDMDFTTQSERDTLTIDDSSAGTTTPAGNLSNDSPTLFIPIEAGIRLM